MNETILIVEDDRIIARLLESELGSEGYRTLLTHDVTSGWHVYLQHEIDLILLDVRLPGLSSIELLRKIRLQDGQTPVILLTAKGSVEDKVSGLDLGANDYVTKPFEVEELLSRIRAALRLSMRKVSRAITQQWLVLEDLRLNTSSRKVERDGKQIQLTQREFGLLSYMMKNQQIVLQRNQILTAVWGHDYKGGTNVVDVYIRYIRKKIDVGFTISLIHTVRGVGYILKRAP